MSGNSIRKRELQRKVLCSLLAAGVMSVCISGGDVWAADSLINAGDKEYTVDTSITADQNLISDNNAIVGIANDQLNGHSVINMNNGAKLSVNAAASSGRAYAVAVNNGADFRFNGKGEFTAIGSDSAQARTIRNNGGGTMSFDGDITVNTKAGKAFGVGIEAWDTNNKKSIIEFKGTSTAVEAQGDKIKVIAVQINSQNDAGSVIDFGADKTVINNTSTAAGGDNWANVAVVEGKNAVLKFSGKEAELNSDNTGYTAQVISLNNGGNVEFNGDAVVLTAKSDYGANGIGGDGTITFNGKNAVINAIVTDGVGVTNSIGLLSSKAINVTDNVDKLVINVYGSGGWNGNPGYANGTAGIYADADVAVAAKELAINVKSGQAVDGVNTYDENDAKKYADYSDAYGVRMMSGNFTSSTETNTNIGVSEGYKAAIGVSAESLGTVAELRGDTTINAIGKTAATALSAENDATITVGSAGKNVTLTAEATEGKSGNLTAAGIYALNGGNVTVDGAAAKITAKVDKTGRAIGVRVEGKDSNTISAVTLNSDSTEIAVSGTTTDNNFNEGVWVKNGNLTANGKELKITGAVSGYTLEGLNVSTNGIIELNTDKTVIDISDNYGVTGITAHNGGTLKVNKGDLIITSTNTAANGIGKTNSIGIQSDEIGSGEAENTIIIGSGVNKVDITVNGAGSEGSTPNASNGTAGIYDVDGNISIDAQTLNVNVTSGSNVSQSSGVYSNATGIKGLNGAIKVGAVTETTITATDGYQDATGVYAGAYNNKQAEISILGNTTIIAIGKTASYALYAEDGGQITVGSAGKTVSLTGNVVSESNGVVTLAGDTNTVKGIVTADGGSVVLNGGEKATYAVDKFVTANSGKITVSGGTLNIDELSNANKFELGKKDNPNNNSLEVTGKGVLQAAAKNIFDATGSSASKVADAVDAKVLFSGGKLAISDASYKLADSKAYSTALAAAESNAAKTTLVMTGTLQQEDIPNNTAGVEDLAPTGAVHTQVTGMVESDTLNIGGAGTGSPDTGTSVNNDLGVKDLDFSGSGSTVESAKVNISNDTGLTLVGDGSSDLLQGTAENAQNKVTVGDSTGTSSAGTLTLGSAAAANSGGTLNAEVKVQADSQMKVEAGSFTVNKIEASQGTVAVNEGAALKTTELIIGMSTGNPDTSTAGAVHAAGTVEVDKLTVNKGTIAVSGSLAASELKASDGASIAVGASENAGTLTAKKVQLNGASIVLDPIWKGNDKITTASKAGLEFGKDNNDQHKVDGKLTVGQNSVLSLGTTDTSKAEAAFAATGLTWGQNDITAALYIDAAQTLDNSNGGIKVDGTLTHDSTGDFAKENTAEFVDNSLLMVNSAAASATNGALKATNSGKLTVDAGAKLYIADAQADQTYTITSGFSDGNSSVAQNGWAGMNLLLNKLVKGNGSFDSSNGNFTVSTEKVKASEALPGVALPNILDAMTSDTNSEYAGIKYLSNAICGLNTDAQTIASVNAFAQGAENSGASHSSVLAAFDTGSIVQGHLSLANKGNELTGGFGKAAADRENNGGIWVQYLHNKDKSDAGYEGQYNGFVLGGDFADKGKYSSGVAFSYGSGDSTGSASKNEYDFWGLSYYGGIRNDDTNLIFDVGYSKNSSEIKGVVNADPDTQIITLGVKGEKMYTNGHGTKFVPYAGLRYMNVDTDSYTGTIDGKNAANYSPDKADLWLLPVGVSITNETVSESGWKVRPTADIAYVWTMGDNDNAMGITVPGINAQDRLGYELMDSGFFVGRLGLEAEKDDWTYGVSYSYQKGSDAQSNKWFVDVKYSF